MVSTDTLFDDMPGHLIRRLHQQHTALFRDHMASAGTDITPVQFAALAALSDQPGLDQAKLAARIAYDKVTIGGVVDRLVAKGLVDRKPSETDRRAKTLTLTQMGEVMLDRARPEVATLQLEILAGLTPEEAEMLTDLLRKAAKGRDGAPGTG